MTPALLLLVTTLLACASPADWGTPTNDDAVFPHGADYDAGTAHGADYLAHGMAACSTCHDPATESTGPPCAECHDVYPHPDGFVDGAEHGQGTWGQTGSTETCDGCHADGSLFAGSTLGCSSCHDSWPHPDGWADSGQHGLVALARGSAVAACGACHGGEALDGGRVGGACTECHASYPHTKGWAEAEAHGAWDGTSQPFGGEACTGCHGEEDGGTAGVACSQCHATWPHEDGWDHGHIAITGPLGEGPCMSCHLPGDGPATMVATCALSCHGGVE